MAPSSAPPSPTPKVELTQIFNHDAAANCEKGIETVPGMKASFDGEKPADDFVILTADADLQYITGIKLYLAVASVSLVLFIMLLDISIIATAIPLITDQFHSLQDVGWYGSAYLLASCAVQPLTGKIYTDFNLKYSFLVFIAVFELGSILCGAASSSVMLIVGRAVAGMGAAGLMNGGLTIVAALAPMPKRPALTGIVMGFGQLGIVLGPLLGGALTQYASWRWCFYINLPIGGVAIGVLLLIDIPETLKLKASTTMTTSKPTLASSITRFDLVGFAIFAPFAIMLLLALEWGGTKYAWNSATIIGLFCGAGALLIIFLVWERRAGSDAMFPFSILRVRIVWCSFGVITCFGGAMMIYSYYLPIYFQAVKGKSPFESGVDILPGIVAQLFATVVSGILLGKTGYYLPWMLTAGVFMSVGMGLMGSFTVFTSAARWAGYQIVASLGRGCGMQIPTVAMQNALPPTQIAIGMSVLIFGQTIGGAVFLALAQVVFGRSIVDRLKEKAPTVDPQAVIAAGATAFQNNVEPDHIVVILEAYNLALNDVFFLSAGVAVGTFVFALGMGWVDIRKKKANTPEPQTAEV
ncbi:Efflux pump mlcE [Lachnellula suecica]|uniref:Efflux pump mlcE n=1 Tax=Lachnellula suecica TaxID=602035 RepID=A0A8T9CAI2_9HELO|nr:Efflux pump mlcE [Lachnellula suecica]